MAAVSKTDETELLGSQPRATTSYGCFELGTKDTSNLDGVVSELTQHMISYFNHTA